jgi:hypothetical protein
MAIRQPEFYCNQQVINLTPYPIVANTPITGTIVIPWQAGSIGPLPYPDPAGYNMVTPVLSTGNTGLTATLVPGMSPTPGPCPTCLGDFGELVYNVTGQVSLDSVAPVFNLAFDQFGVIPICPVTLQMAPPTPPSPPTPSVTSLDCANAVVDVLPNPVTPNTPVTGTVTISYTGGNGAAYATQTVNSTNATGLTATLVPGVLSNGTGGTIVFSITGQVSTSDSTALFNFTFAGQSCQFEILIPTYIVQSNQWYILYPCFNSDQLITFTTSAVFANHIDENIEVTDNVTYEFLGCFTVKVFLGTPPLGSNINNNIVYDGSSCDLCYGSCITVSGLGIVSYLNSTGVETTASLPAKICAFSKPYITSSTTPVIKTLSYECTSDTDCLITCYELTNCSTNQIIYSNNQSLFDAYAGNKTVTLNELDGCWSVDIAVECTCLEDVSVSISYDSCETCLPVVAYVLTNCENDLLQKFSEEDLSIYVGKIVSLDCGDCWYVDQIDYKPPQTQEFVIENVYDSCDQCSRAYFILYPCEGDLEPITTFTDMTSYGTNALKLAGQPGCWTAFTSPTPDYQNAIEVSVIKQYEDCEICLTVTGCTCTKLRNITDGEVRAGYLDCSGEEQIIVLEVGESSPKICINRWVFITRENFEITESGECVDNPSTGLKVCPAALTGRMVRPGYTTPSCDPDKFERITCQTAEILYKQVLQLRYGISNCCPEDDDKTLVKKEVIDIQALNDTNYICSSSLSCNCSSNCNCSTCNN